MVQRTTVPAATRTVPGQKRNPRITAEEAFPCCDGHVPLDDPPIIPVLPVLGELRGRYVAGRELAADRRAVQKSGASSVAGALFKVISGPIGVDLSAAAAIGGDEALEARVDQLETGREPPYSPIPPKRMLASVGGGAVLIWAAVASFVSFTPLMAKLCTGS